MLHHYRWRLASWLTYILLSAQWLLLSRSRLITSCLRSLILKFRTFHDCFILVLIFRWLWVLRLRVSDIIWIMLSCSWPLPRRLPLSILNLLILQLRLGLLKKLIFLIAAPRIRINCRVNIQLAIVLCSMMLMLLLLLLWLIILFIPLCIFLIFCFFLFFKSHRLRFLAAASFVQNSILWFYKWYDFQDKLKFSLAVSICEKLVNCKGRFVGEKLIQDFIDTCEEMKIILSWKFITLFVDILSNWLWKRN